MFSEKKIIENSDVKKEYDRIQDARLKRKLKELQKEKGTYYVKTKNIKTAEDIQKEENVPQIVFHLERSRAKETFDTSLFNDKKKEKPKKKADPNKKPIVSFDFNVSRTKVEKIEIFADDDTYLFAQNFAKKFSKFLLIRIKF